MPANRRQIISGELYELEIRTRFALPFVCLLVVRLLLSSAMARSQRDSKIVICHFLWMANHLHLLFIAKDAEACSQFYSELMKKITDYLKRLLGFPALELWEPGGPVLSQVLDVHKACERVAYLYANPAKADLVDEISQYPGFSSWKPYAAHPEQDSHTEIVPWIRQPAISVVPSRLDERQDKFVTEKLKSSATEFHPLSFHPNALFYVFGVKDKNEISRLNSSIMAEIREREERYAKRRAAEGKTAMGAGRLRREPLMKPHTPKKKSSDRKILFHTSCQELARAFIRTFDVFCDACKEAYTAWRDGNYQAQWPPGAFRPPMRPVANAIQFA